MTTAEDEAPWRETICERAERMRRLHPLERDILILHNRDKVVDARPDFYHRRAMRGVKR